MIGPTLSRCHAITLDAIRLDKPEHSSFAEARRLAGLAGLAGLASLALAGLASLALAGLASLALLGHGHPRCGLVCRRHVAWRNSTQLRLQSSYLLLCRGQLRLSRRQLRPSYGV